MSPALLLPLLLPLLLASPPALARDAQPRDAQPRDAQPQGDVRFGAYARTGAQFYLSPAQTAGGVGGGLGVRATVRDLFVLQADASYLGMVGNALTARLAVGVQRPGLWTPALLAVRTTFLGDRLRFVTGERQEPVRLSATSYGLVLAPLRFSTEQAQVSLLEVGAGLGWDFPGLGTALDVTLLEVALRF